jgi:predicted ATPase/class 3 adenylate cyclase
LAVELAGCDVAITGVTRRRLLAVLASRVGHPMSVGAIIEALWGEESPRNAIRRLRSTVVRLRHSLAGSGSVLVTVPGGYELDVDPGSVDAVRFERLAAEGRRHLAYGDLAAARPVLTEAISLWNGSAYMEFSGESWAAGIVAWLDELRASATEDLAETLLRSGRPLEAVALLRSHRAEHECRERPVALLMRALADAGRVVEALVAFGDFRARLRDAFGIEPTSDLRRLEATLLQDFQAADTDAELEGLPTGLTTFLFTDIEGSTELWEHDQPRMSEMLAAHFAVLDAAVGGHGGQVFKRTGDGVAAVFTSVREAAAAARDAQRLLELPVRMGIDTGESELRDGDYYGPVLNRVARVADAGHSGQIVLSAATAALAPELELIDLGEHRLRGIDAPVRLFQLGAGDFGELRAERFDAGNLPVELTSFVGREADIGRVLAGLGEYRLVTLVGLGGTGKTRLAIAAAAAAAQFADGCRFVDLVPVSVADGVPSAVAVGLGYQPAAEGDVVAALIPRLRGKRLLIVVDNCEHVLAAAATAVDGLVRNCPMVAVLATSREPLRVAGEQLIPVGPLPEPDARELFLRRARAEAPDLALDDQQEAAIDEVCQRLDGLPLAIELAASRVRTFSPVELVTSIDERFRFLVGGRSRNRRHETLRGTLDWSYEQCDPTERVVFDRLATFQTAFSLPAARVVAGDEHLHDYDVIDAVGRLIDRSMMQRVIGPAGDSRYRLLETMRAYGREHLDQRGETETVRARHARAVATQMTTLALSTLGPREEAAREEITALVPDCRTALEWLIEHREWEAAVRVATFGVSDSPREEQELIDLLVHGIDVSGEQSSILAELRSTEQLLKLSDSEWNQLTFDQIRGGWTAPDDRFSYPPQYLIESFTLLDRPAADPLHDELIHSLGTLDHAPLPVRALTEWWVGHVLALAGATTLARDRLATIEDLAERLHSATVRRYASEIRGQIAKADGQWEAAANWFTDALTSTRMDQGRLFEITAAWHRLGASTMANQTIVGEDLRAPWRWLRECNLLTHRSFGAVVTAIALDGLGYRQLAQRFWWWAVQNPLGGSISGEVVWFPAERTDFGPPPEQAIDLDRLIEELNVVADQMDDAAT